MTNDGTPGASEVVEEGTSGDPADTPVQKFAIGLMLGIAYAASLGGRTCHMHAYVVPHAVCVCLQVRPLSPALGRTSWLGLCLVPSSLMPHPSPGAAGLQTVPLLA